MMNNPDNYDLTNTKDIIHWHLNLNHRLILLAPYNSSKSYAGKKPIENDWVRSEGLTYKEAIEGLSKGYNIGWALDQVDLVIDVDPQNGGLTSFNNLVSILPDHTTIPHVISHGDGFHLTGLVMSFDPVRGVADQNFMCVRRPYNTATSLASDPPGSMRTCRSGVMCNHGMISML